MSSELEELKKQFNSSKLEKVGYVYMDYWYFLFLLSTVQLESENERKRLENHCQTQQDRIEFYKRELEVSPSSNCFPVEKAFIRNVSILRDKERSPKNWIKNWPIWQVIYEKIMKSFCRYVEDSTLSSLLS